MQNAIEAVENGMFVRTAATNFEVPRMALKRLIKKKRADGVLPKQLKKLGSIHCVFTEDQEADLLRYIFDMETRMYGLSPRDVRCLAFQLAKKNNIKHPFSETSQAAGKDWFAQFRRRHPNLSLRSPESTSIARARGFNKVVVNKFFDLLKSESVDKKLPVHRIFNVDETSISTVPGHNSKIVAMRGRKQVSRITSADRGMSTTVVICSSAGGNYIPPLFIFSRKRMKEELKDGAPPGSIFSCNANGWMTIDVFSIWFDHFLNHAKPTNEDPALLILDGHGSHTKNLDVIDKARRNNVVLLCLPPHTSHKLQPLDVGVMYPLSRYLDRALENWLNNNPGRTVSVFQISKLFCEAYLKGCTPENAIHGFKKAGIVPFDRHIFSDIDFAPADVSEEAPPDLSITTRNPEENDQGLEATSPERNREPVPGTSKDSNSENSQCSLIDTSENISLDDSFFKIKPTDIRPLPKAKILRRNTNRKKGKTVILTSSPYKNELEQEIKKKKDTERKKSEKKVKNKPVNKKEDKDKGTASLKGKTILKNKSEKSKDESTSSSESESDPDCLICGESYINSVSGEGWIKCSGCLQWAHEACSGVEEVEDDFICDFCRYKPVTKKVCRKVLQ